MELWDSIKALALAAAIVAVCAASASADQCYCVSREQAEKARGIIAKGPAWAIDFCEPCERGGSASYSRKPYKIERVEVVPECDGKYSGVRVNGETADLAYLFVKAQGSGEYQNMAMLAGCEASNVSFTVKPVGEAETVEKESAKFVPAGFTVMKRVQGDLNKDGLADDVLVVKGTDRGKFFVNESGHEVDGNKRGIVVVFREKSGGYTRALENLDCFHTQGEEDAMERYTPILFVSVKNGSLFLEINHKCYNKKYNFRYQNSGFELIGYDALTLSCNVMNATEKAVSVNFLSNKMLTKTNVNENAEHGAEVFREVWQDISVSRAITLKGIGHQNLNDFDVLREVSVKPEAPAAAKGQAIPELKPALEKLIDRDPQEEAEFNKMKGKCRDAASGSYSYSPAQKKLAQKIDPCGCADNYWEVNDGCACENIVYKGSSAASSFLKPSQGITYGAENLNDNSFKTAWAVSDYGIGEYVTYRFDREENRGYGYNDGNIFGVMIANGYIKSESLWKANSRVKKLKMYVDDKPFAILNLADSRNMQWLGFPSPIESYRAFKFEILEVYKGDKYKDAAITELSVWGRNSNCK